MDMNLHGSTTTALAVEDDSQVGHARRGALALASQLGFSEVDAGRVAIVATELSTNLLKHARHGALHLRALPAEGAGGIELIAVDRGPGFDAACCLADGFSTGGTPGTGLGALSRLSQLFDIYSDSRGSVVLAQLFPRHVAPCPVRFGVSQHALNGDPACGDVWHLAVDKGQLSALVIDGLGHGEEAEQAGLAGAAAFAVAPFADPASSLQDMHQAMNGTRGGAAAIARFDAASNTLRFAGIGNIGACLVTPERSRGLASHPGIVGSQFRKAQVFDYPVDEATLLILYSDGLQSRWSLRDYPGLAQRHPAIISTLLHRDFCRGRDDVTVMVIALETVRD